MDSSKLNTYFQKLETDYLYHLGLDSAMELEQMFGDVKFVVLTRSLDHADYFANYFLKHNYQISNLNISCKAIAKTERYHIYKIANTLIISHGVGHPSMLICLNEVIKLLSHAKAQQFQFIRLSAGGGVGVAENSVLLSNLARNYQFKPRWSNIEFGTKSTYETVLDDKVAQAITAANPDNSILNGNILSTSSYYNGQARLNGALATSYTEEERDQYLQKAYQHGVRGIDMESSCFMGVCNHFNIPAATLLAITTNRLESMDTIDLDKTLDDDDIEKSIKAATQIITNYILADKK